MCNGNICPNSVPLQDIRFRNVSDLDFDISRSFKVKCDDVIGLSIYGFLFSMSVSHRLAALPTQDVFSYLLSLGPNYVKLKVHRTTSYWHWTLQGQRYPIYVELLPNFTLLCSLISHFPDNWPWSVAEVEFFFLLFFFFIEITFLEKSQMHQMTGPPNDHECCKAKCSLFILQHYPRVTNATPFALWSLVFQKIEGFDFYIGYKIWWIEDFRKKKK